jgi:hypothetical protein
MKLIPIFLLLAACDGIHPTAENAVLDFQTSSQEGARAVLTPRFEPGTGEMTVSGVLSTPCMNQDLGGEIATSGRAIGLTVRVLASSGCLPAIGYVGYTARISGLPEGAYGVRVVYAAEDGRTLEAGTALVRVR